MRHTAPTLGVRRQRPSVCVPAPVTRLPGSTCRPNYTRAGEGRQVRVRVSHDSGVKRLRFHGVRKEVTGWYRIVTTASSRSALAASFDAGMRTRLNGRRSRFSLRESLRPRRIRLLCSTRRTFQRQVPRPALHRKAAATAGRPPISRLLAEFGKVHAYPLSPSPILHLI